MIKIEHLKKEYANGGLILNDINLEINEGESVVIIGGSGCGKSTLLRCIDRLIEPSEGAIYFKGKNILDKDIDLNEYRQKVGMVYQHFNLFSHLNILENMIVTPMTVLKMPQEDAITKAKELLKKVGMENSIYKMPSELSGGQKQRVSIARTLMMNPEVILFDEPTSALDPTMVDEVESVIQNLIDEGLTAVIVTHEMKFAKTIASKVVFLAEKGVYEQGTPEQIFDNPTKPLTKQFIYRSRLLEIAVTKDNIDLYSLQSDVKKFLLQYGLNPQQQRAIDNFIEEFIYPIVTKSKRIKEIKLSILGSETGVGHKLSLENDQNINLLEVKEVDELALKVYETKKAVANFKNESGTNVLGFEV